MFIQKKNSCDDGLHSLFKEIIKILIIIKIKSPNI